MVCFFKNKKYLSCSHLETLIQCALKKSKYIWYPARGYSMQPILFDGDSLLVTAREPNINDIAFYKTQDGIKAHRVIEKNDDHFITRGDVLNSPSEKVYFEQIIGTVVGHKRNEKHLFYSMANRLAQMVALVISKRKQSK